MPGPSAVLPNAAELRRELQAAVQVLSDLDFRWDVFFFFFQGVFSMVFPRVFLFFFFRRGFLGGVLWFFFFYGPLVVFLMVFASMGCFVKGF